MTEATTAMRNPINVRARLSEFQREMKEKTKQDLSQSDLCATYITTYIFEPYKIAAAESLQSGNIPTFLFFYDFAMGIMEVTSRLYEAEEARTGRTRETFQKYRDNLEKLIDEEDLDTRADAYAIVENQAKVAAQVLEEDPSGFLLVDKTLEELELESNSFQYTSRSKEFILAGAQFAAYIYKHSYRIAQDLYPAMS